ncbi:unnamed protein product, partial [Phaeothamnion confervicola]
MAPPASPRSLKAMFKRSKNSSPKREDDSNTVPSSPVHSPPPRIQCASPESGGGGGGGGISFDQIDHLLDFSDGEFFAEAGEEEYDDADFGTMATFVPTLVLDKLQAMSAQRGRAPMRPAVQQVDAVLMMADVSGFTKLCEAFANGLVPVPMKEALSASTGNAVSSAKIGTQLYRLNNEHELAGFGAEGVREVLNHYFNQLISKVDRHGGDVLRIAGDAIIVMFHDGPKGGTAGQLLLSRGLSSLPATGSSNTGSLT